MILVFKGDVTRNAILHNINHAIAQVDHHKR